MWFLVFVAECLFGGSRSLHVVILVLGEYFGGLFGFVCTGVSGFAVPKSSTALMFKDVAVVGWFFVPVGVADFDCGFWRGLPSAETSNLPFSLGEPEQHCYFVAWNPGLDWLAEESLPDDVKWVLVPCWGFCWGGGFFWWWLRKIRNKFKFYIVGNCLPWVGDY